jgi:hypothetical protein
MLKTEEAVEAWLNEYNIQNYTINKDLTVDVKGSVYLNSKDLYKIEVQFGIVTGDFDCSLNYLESLEGCPKIVNGYFYCGHCKKIKTLKGCPEEIGIDFYGSEFYCAGNLDLKSIQYLPKVSYYNIGDKLRPLLDDYKKLINKLGYDKTQQYWPSIEKMKTLGD